VNLQVNVTMEDDDMKMYLGLDDLGYDNGSPKEKITFLEADFNDSDKEQCPSWEIHISENMKVSFVEVPQEFDWEIEEIYAEEGYKSFSKGSNPLSPILRNSSPRAVRDHALRMLSEADARFEEAVKHLGKETVITKHMHRMMKKRYAFYVDKAGLNLSWKRGASRTAMRKSESFPISSIKAIAMGPRTDGFASYDWGKGTPWLCCSLMCADSFNIDLEFEDRLTMITWLLKLQDLCYVPLLDGKMVTRGRLNWYVGLFRSVQLAIVQEIGVLNVWDELVNQARHESVHSPDIQTFIENLNKPPNTL